LTAIGLEASGYGTHSLRRTKAAEIFRKTGNLRAVQLLLGHTKVDSTVRYLGVELEDALSIAERLDIRPTLASGSEVRHFERVICLSRGGGWYCAHLVSSQGKNLNLERNFTKLAVGSLWSRLGVPEALRSLSEVM